MMGWIMFNKIKELKEKGLKKTQIARILNSDSRTIKKYWNMSSEEFEKARVNFKQRIVGRNMENYKEPILKWLKEYNDISGAQVFDWLKEAYRDFSMAERTVRLYVASLRKNYCIPKEKITRQYMATPETVIGEQAQVDMGQIKLATIEGNFKKVYLFTMALSYSRYKFSQWQTTPFTTKDLIHLHNLAFKYFKGIPKIIVYDQDRTMFVKENSGDIIMTSDFQKYINLSGFKIHLCRAYDPESKGKIEAVVKFVKNNFAKNRIFSNIEEFNQENNEWLIRTGNAKQHGVTKKIPVEVFALEKQYLLPVPAFIDFHHENANNIITYSLGKDNTVTYKSNRYQLPKGSYTSKHKEVKIITKDGFITFFHSKTDVTLATYKIIREKGVLASHFIKEKLDTKEIKVLEIEIINYFADSMIILDFLKLIKLEKPRYLKEQLNKLKEIIEKNSLDNIEKTLQEFIGRGKCNLSDLEAILLRIPLKEIKESNSFSVPIENIPDSMKNIVPEVRNTSEYDERLVKR